MSLSPPPRVYALLLCIHPAFYPSQLNRCLKCHRTQQPAFGTVHLWSSVCLLEMTCCKTGEEGKQVNCMRPKVISQMEGHKHSKILERVLLVGELLDNSASVKACLQLLVYRGRLSLEADCDPQGQRLVLWGFGLGKTPRQGHTLWDTKEAEVLWNRIGGDRRFQGLPEWWWFCAIRSILLKLL